MPTVSGPELCHISYTNEKANSFIETDTSLTLDCEYMTWKENYTDNKEENHEERSHEFSTTNQCSCVGKEESKF